MKLKLLAVLVAVPAAMLAACASGGVASSRPGHAPGTHAVDAEYVAQVERKALSRGVRVHWVQPPSRRTSASASGAGDQ